MPDRYTPEGSLRPTQTPVKHALRCAIVATSLFAGVSLADGEVTAVDSHSEQSTPYQYSIDGEQYLWGVGQDQLLDGFYFKGHHHSRLNATDQVLLQRVDIPGVATGEPCGVFAEFDTLANQLAAAYPQGANGNCDMAAMLAGRVINRGTLDTFSNTGPAPKNIERVDFLYPNGLLTAYSDAGLDVGGHIVAEKRGNNPVQIAAITALDSNGLPSAYGPLVAIAAAGCADPDICYGITAVRHEYSFLQSASVAPQLFARRLSGDTENMAMAFVSSRQLGLTRDQVYYGFSVFGRDVDTARHDLTDPSSFPQDTADNDILEGDGADLYGGMSSLYWDDNASTEAGSAVYGDAYIDQNANGVRDDADVGLGGLQITLYEDSDGDGLFDASKDKRLTSTITDSTGRFIFPGIVEGYYFAELDETSDAIPTGVGVAPGTNPVGFDVGSNTLEPLSFAFVTLQNDAGVQANSDTLSVRQDTASMVEVLANDLDPVGAGLRITAVSAPEHGSVRIDGAQVHYTPAAGYHGADSFSYTAADANNAESSAVVAVNVLKFSDINANGIDDYEECECDDIRLITGIDGSGGGNALWLLALLLLRPWLRVQKNRQGESM